MREADRDAAERVHDEQSRLKRDHDDAVQRWMSDRQRYRRDLATASASRLPLVWRHRPIEPELIAPHHVMRDRWTFRVTRLAGCAVSASGGAWLSGVRQLSAIVSVSLSVSLAVALAILAVRGSRSSVRESDEARRMRRRLQAAVGVLRRQVICDDGTTELSGAWIVDEAIDRNGWRVTLAARPGVVVTDFAGLAAALDSHYRARHGTMNIRPGAHAGHYVVQAMTGAAFPATNWPGASTHTVRAPLPIGQREDGSPFVIDVRRHLLVAGMTGAGKSGFLNVLLGGLSSSVDAEIWGIDMKGGLELAPWRPSLARFADDDESAERLLSMATDELQRRNRVMRERGIRSWIPSPDEPDVFVIVDEFAELAGGLSDVATLARMGRAAGVWLIACTQFPETRVIPSQARNQFMTIVALRMQRAEHCGVVFGSGRSEWDTSRFDANSPGLAHVMTSPNDRPEMMRIYRMSDTAVRDAASNPRCVIERVHDQPAIVHAATQNGTTEVIEPVASDTFDERSVLAALDSLDGNASTSAIVDRLRTTLSGAVPSERTVLRRLTDMSAQPRAHIMREGQGRNARWIRVPATNPDSSHAPDIHQGNGAQRVADNALTSTDASDADNGDRHGTAMSDTLADNTSSTSSTMEG
jgi:DNA segregation ATPase FtsK/SpoIIIE, S-DNA-T family